MWETFKGYRVTLRDSVFITFALLGMVVWLVYFQMNTTLAVFLRDEHGIAPTGFGLLLALNALMVVALQLWITRRLRGLPSMLVLAAGTALYALGFGMYGFVAAVPFFVLAMVIITLGEMVVVPVGQAVATQLAPQDMRGRYMAIFGFSHAIASGSGVWLAGQIATLMGPEYIWIMGGSVLALAALGYARLHQRIGAQVDDALRAAESAPEPEMAEAIPEPAR
jgi:dipeptide/tripeptide permease